MTQTQSSLAQLVQRWIEFQARFRDAGALIIPAEVEAASKVVVHLPFDDPELALEFAVAVTVASSNLDVLARLGTEVLEKLVLTHGAAYMARIEDLCRTNHRLQFALRNAWMPHMPSSEQAAY